MADKQAAATDAPDDRHPRSKISEYTLLEFLGEGATAQVYLAEHEVSGAHVAIKVIDKLLVQRSQLESKIRQEMVLHTELRHPHVLHVEEVFEDARNYYMVLEYCARRSLSAIVKMLPRRKMDEAAVKKVFRQVVTGVAYLHASGVIHRDLKLANLLLNANGEVKISDFGLAARLSDDHVTMCGTPNFIAPEVLASDGEPYDEAVDVWSLGCILYCLLLGKAPFEGRKVRVGSLLCALLASILPSETLENVANAAQNPLKFPVGFSASASDLIKRLLTSEPRNRPSAQQILLHPWLREQLQRRVPPPANGRRKSPPRVSVSAEQHDSPQSPDEKLRGSRRAAVIRSMKEELSLSFSSEAHSARAASKNKNSLESSRSGTIKQRASRGPTRSKMDYSRRRPVVSAVGNDIRSSSSSSNPDDADVDLDNYSDLSDLSAAASLGFLVGGMQEKQEEAKYQEDEESVFHVSRRTEPAVSVIMHLELQNLSSLGLTSDGGDGLGNPKVDAQWSCIEPSEIGSPLIFALKTSNEWEVQYDPASGVVTATTPDGDALRYEIPGVNGTRTRPSPASFSSKISTGPRSSQRAYLPPLVRFCQCLALRTMQLRSIALRDQASKLPLVHYDTLPESILASFTYRSSLLTSSTSFSSQGTGTEGCCGQENAASSSTNSPESSKVIDIPGVGRGCIDATGTLRVVYLDGAQLSLAASGLQLRFKPAWVNGANDETHEDVFELLTSNSMSAFLPSVVKQKLESIPEFIRRLKAAH